MLIIIGLNFVLKGCFLYPAPFLLYNSEKLYFKVWRRIRIHPQVTSVFTWRTLYLR